MGKPQDKTCNESQASSNIHAISFFVKDQKGWKSKPKKCNPMQEG